MFLIVLGFLVWLFATGKFADWLSLSKAPASATNNTSTNNSPTNNGGTPTTDINGKPVNPADFSIKSPFSGTAWDRFINGAPESDVQNWSGPNVTGAVNNVGTNILNAFSMFDPTAGGGG